MTSPIRSEMLFHLFYEQTLPYLLPNLNAAEQYQYLLPLLSGRWTGVSVTVLGTTGDSDFKNKQTEEDIVQMF